MGRGRDFEEELNEYFGKDGIGWAMEDGRIVARGSEAFSAVPNQAIQMLREAGPIRSRGNPRSNTRPLAAAKPGTKPAVFNTLWRLWSV